MRTVRLIKAGLFALFALCVALRVMAWLITPVLPAVAMLLIVVVALSVVLTGVAKV